MPKLQVTYELGKHTEVCEAAWRSFCDANILQRIWDKDHTVWQENPREIVNRLGWLDCPINYRIEIPALEEFAKEICNAGITQVVLLGMGGSSLGAEVFAKAVGSAPGYPKLSVIDTTHPEAIDTAFSGLDFTRTLFIVATKSGSTVETMSLFKYAYNQVGDELGYDVAGEHFVAITDPGSQLEQIASKLDIRGLWRNDPNIGGRYSVLSYFGLVPAALLGLNLIRLLEQAEAVAGCDEQAGAHLGVVLAALAKHGRNKLTICCSPKLAGMGPWLEQLIAESSGKQGRGVLPVLAPKLEPPERYGDDRVFVCIGLANEMPCTHELELLAAAGFPVIRITLPELSYLGAEFFRWQMATACLCHVLGLNPFDQPDVEQAKVEARRIADEVERDSCLECPSIEETVVSLVEGATDAEYIAVLAYLNPNGESQELLSRLCMSLREVTGIPVTLGYGPRYLHSTGQLHKGGFPGGRFLIITADDELDLPIPDNPGATGSSLSFSKLKQAQALGDEAALLAAGRLVLRVHIDGRAEAGLQSLLDRLETSY